MGSPRSEHAYVEAMIDLMKLPLRSPPLKREAPDFLLDLDDGRRVALEVTEAIDRHTEEAFSSITSRLEHRVREILAGRSATATITLTTTVERLFTVRSRRELERGATRVADVVCQHLPRGLSPYNASKLGGLEFLRSITVEPSPRTGIFTSVKGELRPADQVQLAIDPKNDKAARYRSEVAADAYWLLVVGGQLLSGYIALDDVRDRTFKSAFERTLFLEISDRVVVDLSTSAPDNSTADDKGSAPEAQV